MRTSARLFWTPFLMGFLLALHPEWGYDRKLVMDIAKALEQWKKRKSK